MTHILRRPVYAGMVESGRLSRTRYGRELGIVRADAPHEPIIDRATWDAVQTRLDARRDTNSRRRGSWHWLAGRVTCGVCNAPLYYVDATRSDGRGRDQYFRCRNSYHRTFDRAHPNTCPAPRKRVSATILSKSVSRIIGEKLEATAKRSSASILRSVERSQGVSRIRDRERTERSLADLQAQRIRINDAIQQGVGELADLAARDKALVSAIERAIAERDALPAPIDPAQIVSVHQTIHALAQQWHGMSDRQRADACTQLGIAVSVDLAHDTITVTFGGVAGMVV